MPDEEYLLTAALPAGEWALQHIDLYKAQDYLDLINLMAYDFTGSWTPKTGHHAQLHAGGPEEPSGAAAVAYVKSTGFPSKKILLGIPVYGRSFLGATGPEQSYNGHGGESGTIEYKSLPSAGADEIVDTHRVAAFCSGGDDGFVSYDNQETVRIKGHFCKAQELGVSENSIKFSNTISLTSVGSVLLDGYSGRFSRPKKSHFSWFQCPSLLIDTSESAIGH